VQLTKSWESVFPDYVLERYKFAETRNAASILRATSPTAFADIVDLLSTFHLDLEKLTTPGGNQSVIAAELDGVMRLKGWREARYDQELTTTLTIFPWNKASPVEKKREEVSENAYGGHKVDNILGRAALDVEWNPKDGNLDRDLANYASLHHGGVIDVGVLLTRDGDSIRDLAHDLIAQVKAVEVAPEFTVWRHRMSKLSNTPYGTTTTANFQKLVPRIERGDGQGCPILAIGITDACYVPPADIREEVFRIARELQMQEQLK